MRKGLPAFRIYLSFIALLLGSVLSAQTYNMANLGTISTCAGTFYDSGGPNAAYGNNQNFTVTFCSSSGQALFFNFTQFALENNFDFLRIYNGPSVASPMIGNYSGTNSPGLVVSSNPSNCLTFVFTSDGSVTPAGWTAAIGCGTPPPPPPPPPTPSGGNCANAQQFCSGVVYNYPAVVGGGTAQAGPFYGCLGTQPNPTWFVMQIDTAGPLTLTMQSTPALDIDFICWGPFPSLTGYCNNLTQANVVDCSYSTAAVEVVDIPNAQVGQVYVVLITNFSNQANTITFNQTGGAGSTNCNILCNITNVTATPGPCNPQTNTFSLTGQVQVSFPPTSGTLTLTTGCGGVTNTTVINPPYSSPISYTINNVPSTGGNCTVTASFSADPTCNRNQTFTAPAACNQCAVTASNNGPKCPGDSVTLTVTSFTNAIGYSWSAFGQTFTGQTITLPTDQIPSGTYTVTATVNSANCTATATTSVVIRPLPAFGSPTITPASCNASNGAITATTTSTSGPFVYNWSNGTNNTPTVNGLPAGTYDVTITDANQCSASATYSVGTLFGATIDSVSVTDVSCFATPTGAIQVFVSGGAPPLQYVWSPAQTNTATINNLLAGTYELTLTDGNNCSLTGSYTVNEPSVLVIDSAQITPVLCNGAGTGEIEVFVSGGTPTIGYSWSTGAVTSSITSLSGGTYTLTVTDGNQCSVSANYTINEPTAVVIGNPLIQAVSCFGGNNGGLVATASGGTGNLVYTWQTTPVQTGAALNNLIGGNYTVIVTDQNACADTATYTVDAPLTAVVIDSVSVTSVACFGGNSGSLTAYAQGGTGALSYVWTRQSSAAVLQGQTISGLFADTYSLTVTDANGCTATASAVVNQPAELTVNTVVVNNTCFGFAQGSITATGAGGTGTLTYSWSNGLPSGNQAVGLVAGSYTLTVTDQNLCTVTATATVTQPTQLVLNPPVVTAVSCFGGNNGAIDAQPTGGTPAYQYLWSNGQTTQAISSLIAGSYDLTLTDANQCSASATYNVTQPLSALAIQNTPQVNVNCYGDATGSASIQVTGGTPVSGYQYSWTGNVSSSSAAQNLSAGVYTVTVTDANGCSVTHTYTITEPASALLSNVSALSPVSCNGGVDGSVTLITQGGTAPYAYVWSANAGGQTDSIADGLAAGSYSVTVFDALSCSVSTSATLQQPAPITSSPIINPVLCFGGNTGSVDINPAGGLPAYTFSWSDGQSGQTAINLSSNAYSVTVFDSRQCSATFSVNVPQPTLLTISGTQQGESCPGENDGQIETNAAGGLTPYVYSLTGPTIITPNATGDFSPLAPGSYSIQVTDQNGCQASESYVIGAAQDDVFNVAYDSVSCYGYTDGGVLIEAATLGNAPFTYSINNGPGQLSGDFYGLAAGPHVVFVLNNQGCETIIPVVVPQPLPVIADVNPDTVIIALGATGSVDVTALNLLANPLYEWSPTLGLSCSDCPNPDITTYQSMEYVVTVSYMNGESKCSGETTLWVEVLPETDYYIPNVFSPNGDGNNDVFNILGSDIRTVDLRIFNRWGELVFQSNNTWTGWDGTYKSKLQSPGVYTYYAAITYLNGKTKQQNGSVTLVR